MKTNFNPFRGILALGGLGIILLLLAGAILWALFSQVSDPFDAAQERVAALNILENDVSQALNQMALYEARKVFSLEYEQPEDQDYARLAEESDAAIDDLLALFEEEGHLEPEHEYVIDIRPELENFNALRAAHRQTFAEMVQAYEADDPETGFALVDQLETETDEMNLALRAIVVYVEQGRLAAQRDFPEDINASIFIAASGLALSLLLALAGYQWIASAVRPLRALRNAVTAMEGDQYRPELLANLLKKPGAAGQLARALDGLAQSVQQRDAGLKAEIERLRQALYESRRRRLKIVHPSAQGKEAA